MRMFLSCEAVKVEDYKLVCMYYHLVDGRHCFPNTSFPILATALHSAKN